MIAITTSNYIRVNVFPLIELRDVRNEVYMVLVFLERGMNNIFAYMTER